jgi:hypothetical protein
VVDCFALVDLCISFITTYFTWSGKEITDHRHIVLHYLKGWFVFDLIPTLPWYLLLEVGVWWPGVKLLRLLRVSNKPDEVNPTGFKLMSFVSRRLYLRPSQTKIFKLAVLVLLVLHFSALLWFYLQPVDAVVKGISLRSGSPQGYLVALYWASTTLTTVGWGDIVPFTSAGMLLTIFVMLVGSILFAYFIALISSMLGHQNQDLNHLEQLRMVSDFANQTLLTQELRIVLFNEINLGSLISRGSVRWNEIRTLVSPQARVALSLYLFRRILSSAPFFVSLNPYPQAVRRIAYNLTIERLLPHAVLALEGGKQHSWYICAAGSCAMVISTTVKPLTPIPVGVTEIVEYAQQSSGAGTVGGVFTTARHQTLVCCQVVRSGETLGETGFLDGIWPFSVVATTQCTIFYIERGLLLAILSGTVDACVPIPPDTNPATRKEPLHIVTEMSRQQRLRIQQWRKIHEQIK